ncbi:MAG: NFACT RNA binding domain-containing protein [Spirochaetota bacterium]
MDAVLEELDLPGYHVQQLYQPDFRNLVLELYRPGDRLFLLVSFEQGRTRMHKTSRKPKKSRTVQRFEALLKSRIRGGRIVCAEQPGGDRIVCITIDRAGERTLLWLRLWGGAANLIATRPDGVILDCFYRRPKRGEVSGAIFDTGGIGMPTNGDQRKKQQFSVREHPDTQSLNEFLDAYYAEEARAESIEQVRSECSALIRRREASLQARLDDIIRGLSVSDDAERYRHHGNLILAALHTIKDGDERLTTEDWANDNAPITINLDPSVSPGEHAQNLFQKAQKAELQKQDLRMKQQELSNVLSELRSTYDTVQNSNSIRELLSIRSRVAPSAPDKDRSKGPQVPGLRFESAGFTLLVGRNARENDTLLRRHVRGNDLWLHTRDYPGGYVFILHRGNKSPPLETLLDAGHLAVHYSQASSESRVNLYYTPVKYLRRAREAPTGTVIPTQEKNLEVHVDNARLRKLLSQQSRY